MFRDIILLLSRVDTVNAMGDVVSTPTSRTVYANRKSIRQSEFYQAAATGLRPQVMFEIRTVEYQNEPDLEHDGITYRIIRTFEKGEFIELIAGGIVGEMQR